MLRTGLMILGVLYALDWYKKNKSAIPGALGGMGAANQQAQQQRLISMLRRYKNGKLSPAEIEQMRRMLPVTRAE